MELLLLYWFITTVITIGIGQDIEGEFKFLDIIFSILFGWIILPIKLGKLISHLHRD